jgi:hypothetical protein
VLGSPQSATDSALQCVPEEVRAFVLGFLH